MDVVTLALAKQYTDSQRIGYAESASLTFDGYTIGKDFFEMDHVDNLYLHYVRIADYVEPGVIKGVELSECKSRGDGVLYDHTAVKYVSGDAITLMPNPEVGMHYVSGALETVMDKIPDAMDAVFVSKDMEGMRSGIWVALAQAVTDNGIDLLYISRIDYETVHTIDPKYIPALDSLTLNGADGKQYKLAVDESGALAATAIE